MINMMSAPSHEESGNPCGANCFYGAVTIGERGQVVIPAEARAELGLKPGDKLVVLRHPVIKGVMMAKFESLQAYFEEFARQVNELSEADGAGE